ncbi:MAG: flagellar biosynthesis protein FlhB [Campylobacterota bacterium]|nr:flagellar biosynthesis protein FlhB [Campylobacterota bacterium]
MADDAEKTEEPTSKKIDDAKKKGNVPKSAEVPGVAILFFSSIYLLFFSSSISEGLKAMMIHTYSFIDGELDNKIFYELSVSAVENGLISLMPLFSLIVFLAIIGNVVQFGFILTPIKLELSKIDPIGGMKNLFSMKKFLEAFKLTIKLIVVFIVMVVLLYMFWKDIIMLMDHTLQDTITDMIRLATYFIFTILFIIVIFAIIDFVFVRYFYFKQLRMSKQEIKDEHKNMEGDPLIKGKIRQIQMKMAKQRMMADVPDADVVITNPTHYAVALKYEDDKTSAPIVVAKGIDFLALKIKEIALESKIPLIEDPALARAIYNQVEIQQEIPEEFYKSIAEIFTYIYKLNKK